MILIYSIDGNIGSGKSTIVESLKSKFKEDYLKNDKVDFVFVDEPVDIWQAVTDEDGENILEKFYKDQTKYSFPFQMMAYISRLSRLKSVIKRAKKDYTVIVTERSVFTDYEIFAKMLHDDKKIEEINYNIYKLWFNEFINELPFRGVIYIKTDPTLCEERIKIRNRDGENIPLSYLEKCHDYHEKWISSLKNKNNKIKIIDGNLDKECSLNNNVNDIISFLTGEILKKCNIVVQFTSKNDNKSVVRESIAASC
jgi:deoxyadenosine/deoxycytidine kinase